ncbi:MAG: TrkH family potassium uptake protein [Synechococcales cyanobacterium]
MDSLSMNPVRTICLGFMGVIGVGTLLLCLPFANVAGEWGSLLTALFMSTSAVCVTGLAVVDVGSYYTGIGQFILLLLVQIGGLGYMTANTFLLLLLGRRFGLKDKLALQQSLDRPSLGGGSQLIRSIIAVTATLEILGVILLSGTFVPEMGWDRGLWFAIFHSISAFNNAGFGLLTSNFIDYRSSFNVVGTLSLLIILGGIGYNVIMEAVFWLRDHWQRRLERVTFSLNTRIVLSSTTVLLLGGAVTYGLMEWGRPLIGTSWVERGLAIWFQSVTTRTAGFNTIDIGQLSTAALCLTIALMFVGASPGGTGGGVKTTTIQVLVSCTKAVLQGKEEVITFERQIPMTLVLKAVGVVFGSLGVVATATMALALIEQNLDFLQLLFEVVSAFATVGLSTGITATLHPSSQFILVITMYIGRVGILTLMSALQKEATPSRIHYPEESFLVG